MCFVFLVNIIKVCRMSAVEGIDIDSIIRTEDIHETPACFLDKIERDFTVSVQSWPDLSEICTDGNII